MLKKGLYTALVVGLLLGVGLFSGCRSHGHGRGAEFAVDYVTDVLDLTDEQQVHLNQIKEEFMVKRDQMRANKAKHYDEIIAQLGSEEIDQERVMIIVAEHRAQMDEIIDLAVVRIAEFHRTLTPEQKAKLVKKIESFKKYHDH
jgi:Spy/CpxP family protein refolding chaperone